jgi:GT2 family glycosyltransferase
MIPVYIPTFNNPTYTSNFISQLERFNLNKITVVDNASTFPPMVKLLNEISNKYELIRLNKIEVLIF